MLRNLRKPQGKPNKPERCPNLGIMRTNGRAGHVREPECDSSKAWLNIASAARTNGRGAHVGGLRRAQETQQRLRVLRGKHGRVRLGAQRLCQDRHCLAGRHHQTLVIALLPHISTKIKNVSEMMSG